VAVNLTVPETVFAVPGVTLGTACAEIKQAERHDLAVIHFQEGTTVAGVYTQSAFAAPPVALARGREYACRAWVVNSGNANAATGERGAEDADAICAHAAAHFDIDGSQVQPFSTGVIGERLPVERMLDAVDVAAQSLAAEHWHDAARAIMTTDTMPKLASRQVEVAGQTITITGIAKGSGMIKPDMATMLAYIACDAPVEYELLKRLVKDVADASFNRITVDGDTSTNDCFMVACTGAADLDPIADETDTAYAPLRDALFEVAQWLARAIVRDGEGATKFVTVRVDGGATAEEALSVAYTVAESPLVKTALFAGDANWGRFCMAIGRAPVVDLDAAGVSLWLDDVQVAEGGLMSASYTEADGARVMAQDEFSVRIDLGRGPASEWIWTTDLSYDYVKINAEYRT
jgi:glutamate N-acetyltransferase/amino-acid N-acetyltransferase